MSIIIKRNRSICAREQGASLIEVMVAALILGIGMLGVLSLQGRSLQYNQQAYLSSQASILAQDMAERIMSNSGSDLQNYLFEGSPSSQQEEAAPEEGSEEDGSAPAESGDCSTGECSPEELANWDKTTWIKALSETLPRGYGEIYRPEGEDYVVVRVYYSMERDSTQDDALHYIQLLVTR